MIGVAERFCNSCRKSFSHKIEENWNILIWLSKHPSTLLARDIQPPYVGLVSIRILVMNSNHRMNVFVLNRPQNKGTHNMSISLLGISFASYSILSGINWDRKPHDWRVNKGSRNCVIFSIREHWVVSRICVIGKIMEFGASYRVHVRIDLLSKLQDCMISWLGIDCTILSPHIWFLLQTIQRRYLLFETLSLRQSLLMFESCGAFALLIHEKRTLYVLGYNK